MTTPIPGVEANGGQGVAQLTNMSLALSTVLDLQQAGSNSPRMGCFYGESGYGKTVASAFVAAQLDAVYLKACSVWTVKTFLSELSVEIGLAKPPRTAPAMLEAIVEQMTTYPRPIIIDEFDFLVKRQSVEVVRDIHDALSELPEIAILLIGEEALPHKLKQWERFHNRILMFTPAQPASPEDARRLRDLYCQKIKVADDLVEHIRRETRGVTRRIRVNLEAAQRFGIEAGEMTVDCKLWGDRRLLIGEAPRRRTA
ncbi:hypothetical protein B5C34_05285 [Pacificimonas flava]|uniref:ORC1/DEAH AAA+ ATPase domain-containing protein n=2 Tax=Pacificimonas TaxID=1960290 RepID=A0A219B3L6_9SPHN|nr:MULTISPECIES: ATP-binding protein [Pacificimonas]MBZ6377367.1 ATP-binding protein [Pacificimonas aurantium]OWV32925.1 hypothetical protein B5C34_05285 [Pacificimonas flava]